MDATDDTAPARPSPRAAGRPAPSLRRPAGRRDRAALAAGALTFPLVLGGLHASRHGAPPLLAAVLAVLALGVAACAAVALWPPRR